MSLPIGEKSSSIYLYIIFLISMCLLPFSTGGGLNSNSVVITFAFPFLFLLCIFILYNLISKEDKNRYPDDLKFTIICAFLYTFAIFISSLMNKSLTVSFGRSIFHLFGFVIFLYVIANSSIRKNAISVYEKVTSIFIFSGLILSVYFITNFLIAVQQNSLEQVLLERENGGLLSLPWGASNTIAACLMMPFFLALDRVFNLKYIGGKKDFITTTLVVQANQNGNKHKKIGLIINIFMILVIIAAIVITQSRNVIATVTAGMVIAGILTGNKKSIAIFFALVATALFSVIIFSGQDFDGVLAARVGDQAQDIEGFNGRTLVWDVSISYFLKHPFQPLGYFGMLAEIGHTAHNVFMTTLIEQGICGLIVYVLFLINNFSFCIKNISSKYLSFVTKKRMTIFLIALLSMLLQHQFEDSNFTGPNIIYQWIFWSLMYLSVYCDLQAPLIPPRRNVNFNPF